MVFTHHSIISELCKLLENDFSAQLGSDAASLGTSDRQFLRIEGVLCNAIEDGPHVSPEGSPNRRLVLGYIDLRNEQTAATHMPTPSATPDNREDFPGEQEADGESPLPPTFQSFVSSDRNNGNEDCKRRKVVGGLRLSKSASTTLSPQNASGESDDVDDSPSSAVQKVAVRQVCSETRFPQRKRKDKFSVPVLEPTSADKLVAGIWRQLHSNVQLGRAALQAVPPIHVYGPVSGEVFRAVSMVCLRYYNQSQSSRALEMIVQAYWIECYEARIAALRTEKPDCSATEARMAVLTEACAVLGWKEKDLRNRLAIWRGYKEIKDAGGWASLVFASSGVYRFCKYRKGFDEGVTTRLRQIRSSVEVAADTLHPEWRQLLDVIGQGSPRRYHGHPHEWVTVTSKPALALDMTYRHLMDDFNFQFIEECVLDRDVFPDQDPRRTPDIDPDICQACKELQSDDVRQNRCFCFPALFGGPKNPIPVQLFHTASGKNNGVVARCNFERGMAIGEFVGLVTKGIEGLDVMVGGYRERSYQIFQGRIGNFTRFINHSCYPNSQFQKFYWRGMERIIVVSRGIAAGTEITVDYSDHYWRQLNKICLCGEPCCRFSDRRPRVQ